MDEPGYRKKTIFEEICEEIKLTFTKWMSNTLSYMISWLGLKMFYEHFFILDKNGKVQALLFTNDSRYVMIMKNEAQPLVEAADKLANQLELLRELLIQKGVVFEYEETDNT